MPVSSGFEAVLDETSTIYADQGGVCRYVSEIEVPDSAFYTPEVAGRKGTVYDRARLERENWNVSLQIR